MPARAASGPNLAWKDRLIPGPGEAGPGSGLSLRSFGVPGRNRSAKETRHRGRTDATRKAVTGTEHMFDTMAGNQVI